MDTSINIYATADAAFAARNAAYSEWRQAIKDRILQRNTNRVVIMKRFGLRPEQLTEALCASPDAQAPDWF